MLLTLSRNELLRAVSSARSVVPSRTTIPIIGNVLLSANGDGRLSVTGNNLEAEAGDSAAASIAAEGRITVPADTLMQIAKSLPDGADVKLELDLENSRVAVSSGRSRFRLGTLPADDFPSMPMHDWQARITLPTSVWRRLLVDTLFAVSTDETRYYMNGVYLSQSMGKPGTVTAAATDGHRAIIFSAPLPDEGITFTPLIVPRQAQADMGKMLDGDGDADMTLDPRRLSLERGTYRYISKTVDGEYPDLLRIVPPLDRARTRIAIDRAVLAAAVARVRAISDDKLTRLAFYGAGDELKITTSQSTGIADAEDAVPCEIDGPAIEWGCNGRYMLEQLAVMRGSVTRINLIDPSAAIRLVDDGSPDDIHVMMPMRV